MYSPSFCLPPFILAHKSMKGWKWAVYRQFAEKPPFGLTDLNLKFGMLELLTWIMLFKAISILLKEPFALKNSETVYFTSIFSTPSYSDIAPIDNFNLTFFYFYFVFEVFDTIQF